MNQGHEVARTEGERMGREGGGQGEKGEKTETEEAS